MSFEFRDSDTVLLGNGPFAKEFLDAFATMDFQPNVIDCRKHSYSGNPEDKLIKKIGEASPGRVFLIGHLGNLGAVPFPSEPLRQMFTNGHSPTSFAAIRVALLHKHVSQLGFTSTHLREAIRSGQERDGGLCGPIGMQLVSPDLDSVAEAAANDLIRHDYDTLILRGGRSETAIEYPTLNQVPNFIAAFKGEAPRSATLIARKAPNPLESRYVSPAIAQQCADSGLARLTLIGRNLILLDLGRFRTICTRSGLELFRSDQ